MLTKKTFQQIADTIKGRKDAMSAHDHRRLAEEFADMCARTNPRFDRHRFMQACGCLDG